MGILMFVLIGFIAGFIVGFSVYRQNEINARNPRKTSEHFVADNHGIRDLCTCDVAQNKSSISCNPCLEQYWSLELEYNECFQSLTKIKNENIRIQHDRNTLFEKSKTFKQCELNKKMLGDANRKC